MGADPRRWSCGTASARGGRDPRRGVRAQPGCGARRGRGARRGGARVAGVGGARPRGGRCSARRRGRTCAPRATRRARRRFLDAGDGRRAQGDGFRGGARLGPSGERCTPGRLGLADRADRRSSSPSARRQMRAAMLAVGAPAKAMTMAGPAGAAAMQLWRARHRRRAGAREPRGGGAGPRRVR